MTKPTGKPRGREPWVAPEDVKKSIGVAVSPRDRARWEAAAKAEGAVSTSAWIRGVVEAWLARER